MRPQPERDTGDADLARALAEGDRAVFERLYRRHNAALIGVGTAILHSRASAEEVAQETWLSVLGNIGGFEGRSSLAGWIFTIMANKARTRAARDGRMVSFGEDDGDDGLAAAFDGRGRWKDLPDLWEDITPERIVAGRSLLDHVNVAIDRLPPLQRAVLILRAGQDLEASEVCAILAIPDSRMRALLHRARGVLRADLARVMAAD